MMKPMSYTERQHRLERAAWSRATAVGTWSLTVTDIAADTQNLAAPPDGQWSGCVGSRGSTAGDHTTTAGTGERWAGGSPPFAEPAPAGGPTSQSVPPVHVTWPATAVPFGDFDFSPTVFGSSWMVPAP